MDYVFPFSDLTDDQLDSLFYEEIRVSIACNGERLVFRDQWVHAEKDEAQARRIWGVELYEIFKLSNQM
jgi:hypothetical protein